MSNMTTFFEINNIIDLYLENFLEKSNGSWDSSYPPYPVTNHYLKNDSTNVLEVSVPGAEEKDITVNVENDILTISLRKHKEEKPEEKPKEEIRYITRRIAKSDFTVHFKLSAKLDVDNIKANLKNGLLILELPLKPEAKPVKKTITIS
jgi:HSP20 family protein